MAARDGADWRSLGACLSADPDLFFPISPDSASQREEARAKAVCATCGVRAECLAFAMKTRQVHGVWGGLGEAELARLRRSHPAPDSRPAPDGRPLPERITGGGPVVIPRRGSPYPEPSAR